MSTTVYSGAFATRPVAGTQNDIFLPTDSPILEWDDGANWQPWGPVSPVTEPPTAGWSWVNQGSAAIAETKGGLQLTTVAEAVFNLRCRVRALPSPTVTIDCGFTCASLNVTSRAQGIVLRDSGTGRIVAYFMYGSSTAYGLVVMYFTNATTYSSNPVKVAAKTPEPMFLRVVDDNTNFTFYYSRDGLNWVQTAQVGRTAWLASPDEIGFGIQATTGYDHAMTVFDWSES